MSSSTTESPFRPLRLLSLDGGGVRGLSTLVILRHLMKRLNPTNPPKPCEYFQLIGGTSTGGLIAVMLGRLELSIDDCIAQYLATAEKAFQRRRAKSNFLGRAKDTWRVEGAYSTAGLETAVKDLVQQKEGNEKSILLSAKGACKVFVCAHTKALNSRVQIRSYSTPEAIDDLSLDGCRIWEAVRATSAAATFFDPIKIGRQEYVDGGTGMNNPVELVLEEARSIWHNADSRIRCIVSIGTGKAELRGFGNNANEVVQSLKSIATDTEQAHIRFLNVVKHNGLERSYFRFEVERGLGTVELDEHEKVNVIEDATERYLKEPEIKAKVSSLVDWAAEAPYHIVDQATYFSILKSLPVADPQPLHEQFVEKHTTGTGTWFFKRQFDMWKTAAKSFIWIYGKPGCGKSILCSAIVHELQSQLPEGHALAYFYLTFRRKEPQNLRTVLESLIRQIAHGLIKQKSPERWQVPKPLQEYHDKHMWGKTPSLHSLQCLFKDLVGQSNACFVIIDALDECPRIDDRQAIIRFFSEYICDTASQLRLLIASRQEHDIQVAFDDVNSSNGKVVVQKMQIKDEYVRHDVEIHIKKWMEQPAKLNNWSSDSQELIVHTLLSRANGNFRYVECQLDELATKKRKTDLEAALQRLPRTLDETYAQIIERISNDGYKQEAWSTLQWLAYSHLTLKVEQLAEITALKVEEQMPSAGLFVTGFDESARFDTPKTAVQTVLSHLAMVLRDGQVVLTHFSVLEYLKSDRCDTFFRIDEAISHRFILECCLTYNVCCTEACNPKSGASGITKDFPLMVYTSLYWSVHGERMFKLSGIEGSTEHMILDFFTNQHAWWDSWLRITGTLAPENATERALLEASSCISPASLLSFHDMYQILDLFDSDPNRTLLGIETVYDGVTPLIFAARKGYGNTTKTLLKLGAATDTVDRRSGASALHYTAAHGLDDAVNMLLDNVALLEKTDLEGRTALHYACLGDSEVVLKTLLSKSSPSLLEMKDIYGFTALHLSVKAALWDDDTEGMYEGAQPRFLPELLAKGADANSKTFSGRSVLQDASECISAGVREILVENGAEIWDVEEYYEEMYFPKYSSPWFYGQYSHSIWRALLREFWTLELKCNGNNLQASTWISRISCMVPDDIIPMSLYKALNSFLQVQCQTMGAALKASTQSILLERYVMCWVRYRRVLGLLQSSCYKLHKHFVYDKQAEGRQDIWEVAGLLMYHWKVDVLDADSRILETALNYIETRLEEENHSIPRRRSRRDELLSSFAATAKWIQYAKCAQNSDHLSDGAKTLEGEFIEIDWFKQDPKWVRLVEFEQKLLHAGGE